MQEALNEDFKETWVRVNPNAPMPFVENLTNEENEEGDSENGFNHYTRWSKYLLPLLISVTPETDSTFAWWYLDVSDPDKTEANIGGGGGSGVQYEYDNTEELFGLTHHKLQ